LARQSAAANKALTETEPPTNAPQRHHNPPLKVIVASVTTSAALMRGDVALMVLPTLVAGNELLILGGVGLTVSAWFLAHRHGQLRRMVAGSMGGQMPVSNQSSVVSKQ
jgi:hypothetical protein